MIGVIADPSRHAAVREFFELFKTPWEFYRHERQYDVVISDGSAGVDNQSAKVVVAYGSSVVASDSFEEVVQHTSAGPTVLRARDIRVPVYKGVTTFRSSGTCVLFDEGSRQPAAYMVTLPSGNTLVRIGYSIFDETAALLMEGQPLEFAPIPSLELHISLLRRLIVGSGAPLVEIPPVPDGYRFIACLTHDVDHPSIKLHRFDHTMFGFLYRATIGSALGLCRRELPIRSALTNWAAVLKLPFVHLGVAEDFWDQLSAYTPLDRPTMSSFFVIPFKNRPGTPGAYPSPKLRASAYGADDIAGCIRQLSLAGHEVGLHGIDSWHDEAKAKEELSELRRVTEVRDIGVRMHWLYFDRNSPAVLDGAGFDYDSSVGYNETAGYRAGTTQVYRPLNATRLLELPLHVMDTALFLSGRQHLSRSHAAEAIDQIVDNAVQFGGVVTINWHDRSIAPERLWRDFYIDVLAKLKSRGAWLANARDTVRWFRKRRSAEVGEASCKSGEVTAKSPRSSSLSGRDLPGLLVRSHNVATAERECLWPEVEHGGRP